MSQPVTVVSGVPRSGTSLMMSLLARAGLPVLCDDGRPPDASNPRGYFELEAVRRTRDEPGWLRGAPGHAVKVIHHLLDALPADYDYRVILMRRPWPAVVASQNRMLERLGKAVTGPDDARLAAILSAQWEESRSLLEAGPHFRWMVVDYPDLVREPRPRLRRLADFLDLPLDFDALVECIDPSLEHGTNSSP
jgi:hypothetical protein